jgi:hypothetical protein
MAITTCLHNSAKVGFLSGAFAAGDTYKLALFTSAATLNSGTTAYSTTNEVANGNGYTTGGVTLTGITYVDTNGTGSIDWGDASWPASTITARGALLYKSGGGDPSIASFDFGGDIVSTNGTFLVTIPAAGVGVIRIA